MFYFFILFVIAEIVVWFVKPNFPPVLIQLMHAGTLITFIVWMLSIAGLIAVR